MKINLAPYRKFLVAVGVVLGEVVALGVLHGTVLHYVQLALSALGAAGVYLAPNVPAQDGEDWTAAPTPPPAPAAPATPPATPSA